MRMEYGVKKLVCNYAVICEDTNMIMCICNIRKNAELIADILNADNDRRHAIFYGNYPNAKYKIIRQIGGNEDDRLL